MARTFLVRHGKAAYPRTGREQRAARPGIAPASPRTRRSSGAIFAMKMPEAMRGEYRSRAYGSPPMSDTVPSEWVYAPMHLPRSMYTSP